MGMQKTLKKISHGILHQCYFLQQATVILLGFQAGGIWNFNWRFRLEEIMHSPIEYFLKSGMTRTSWTSTARRLWQNNIRSSQWYRFTDSQAQFQKCRQSPILLFKYNLHDTAMVNCRNHGGRITLPGPFPRVVLDATLLRISLLISKNNELGFSTWCRSCTNYTGNVSKDCTWTKVIKLLSTWKEVQHWDAQVHTRPG